MKKLYEKIVYWIRFLVTHERVIFFWKSFLYWGKRILFWLLGGSVFFVILYIWVNPPFTPLMMIRFADQLVDGRSIVLQQEWVAIENISPNVIYAVVAGEDQRFVSHI